MTNRDYNNSDYTNFILHYSELLNDIYSQPSDEGHFENMNKAINKWIAPLGIGSVLDVGAGEGKAIKVFKSFGIDYLGCAINENFDVSGKNLVGPLDFNFVTNEFGKGFFDLVFSRHSLEHSPFPLLTLMEWHDVSKKWLCLILPNPEHYTYVGRNHYSVMNAPHAAWILRRAGWKMKKVHIDNEEIWFLCEKAPRLGHEGWAESPLHNKIYEFERDLHRVKGEIDVTKYFADRKWHGLF